MSRHLPFFEVLYKSHDYMNATTLYISNKNIAPPPLELLITIQALWGIVSEVFNGSHASNFSFVPLSSVGLRSPLI